MRLRAASVLAVFAMLRMFVPTIPAVIGAAWLACSPLQLSYAPHLRDFVKAPFVLAALAGMVALVVKANTRWLVAATAAITGVVIGVGVGFRMDVAIMVPIAVISILMFRGARPWRAAGEKALAIGVLLVALAASGWPVWSRLSAGGSNAVHVVLLGSAEWFDRGLGVEPGPYGYLPFYSDTYVNNVVRARAAAATGLNVIMPSREYDAASLELWLQWLRHFPADAFTRLLAATNGVLNLAFDNPLPAVAGSWPVSVALTGVWDWLNGWRGWGWALGVAMVWAAACGGLGRAVFAAMVLMALAGYPSLQYDPRHYFHLQALPLTGIVLMAWASAEKLVASIWSRKTVSDQPAGMAMRPWLVTALVVGAITVVPATTLRAYQASHLESEFSEFLRADRVPLEVELVPIDSSRWLARWPEVKGVETGVPGLSAAYYVAEFTADGSNAAMAIGLRYNFAPAWVPCTLTRRLTSAPGVARFAFAAYSLEGDSRFEGIEMGAEMRRRLVGIHRVPAGPAGLPMEARLAADWDRRRLSQRLVQEERLTSDDVGVAVMGPADHCGSQMAFIDASLDPRLAVMPDRLDSMAAPSAGIAADGLVVDGSADAGAPAFAAFKPVQMIVGDAVIARLWIEQGGVVLRLLRDGVPVREVVVPRPGLSLVVLPVSDPGKHVLQVASAAAGWRRTIRFTLDRVGIVRGDGRVSTGIEAP